MSVYDYVKKYRGMIMGISILWIMFYHSGLVLQNPVLNFIKGLGYGGVDIFLLCSGFGVAHSLTKRDTMDFYQKRISKLYPTYAIFILVYIIYHFACVDGMNISEIAGVFTLTGWWMGYQNQFNWYVSAIFVFYLISPIMFILLQNEKKALRNLVCMIIYFLVLCCAAINFDDKIQAVGRLPIYAIGMYWGLRLSHQKIAGAKEVIYSLLLIAIGVVISILSLTIGGIFEMLGYGVTFLILTPGFCILIPYIFEKLSCFRIFGYLIQGFEFIGRSSFEIYLIHIAIFKYLMYEVSNITNIGWLLAGGAALLFGCIYHFMMGKLISISHTRK